jgi:beta-lactamase class A
VRAGQLVRALEQELAEAGLRGSFLVRDLDDQTELGIQPDVEYAIASLAKIPLALAVLEGIRVGRLDGATSVLVPPGRVTTPGPTGISRFRHPVRVAVDDLLYLSVCLSDGSAAEALFALTPPAMVAAELKRVGLDGIHIRHSTAELAAPVEQSDVDNPSLAQHLAIGGATGGRGHIIPQLDTTRGNSASARALMELLQSLWTRSRIHPDVAARVRELMRDNVLRQRLAPDFSSDASGWSSKTGTLLNLRHEIGVVEHAEGRRFGVVALTESRVPAANQPATEALMGHVARRLRDQIRQARP